MIRTPTTFVVGAGAGVGYGLPTSRDLVQRARKLKPGNDKYQLLMTAGITPGELNDFLADLRQHPARSIDAFLESRQHHQERMKVGRALLAVMMAESVIGARKDAHKPEDDWLGYVIEQMSGGAPTCLDFASLNKEVRFVTFNFDTVIEERLERDMRAIYRDSDARQLGTAIDSFKVVHVHGALPEIPTAPMAIDPMHARADAQNWQKWINEASSCIHVVLDEIDKDLLKDANQSLLRASVICFLGFAYARENLERLDMRSVLTPKAERSEPVVFGSAYGLEDGERQTVRGRLLDKITLGGKDQNSLAVLRGLYIFRD
jgi:hypothetical protein